MSEYIYVLGVDGDPQMPTKRKRHVEQLLQTGRARVFRQIPFTIQLTYENKPVLQPITIAEDPGRSNIGMAVVSLSGELLSAAVVQTRNKEIVKLMDKRKQHRRASRNGERKARQRLAKKCHTMIKAGFLMRKLPMYGKDKRVKCLVIKNTESRFCNRKREDGWLTPSAEHLVQTHINLIHKMQKFLPITDVAIEINRFAFLSLEDPSISGVDFQKGPLKGYDDLNAAVEDLQDGHCLMCNTPYDYLGYNTTKKVDVMPKRIIFHKGTWEFYQLIGFDPDLEEYIIRPYKMKRARYQNVTQEELDDDYTNDKNEIMQLMEEREKIISDRLSFAEYIYDKIPERTIWTYYHVVRQLDHIQNMDFYKDEKNKQTLAQVRHPLRKAIRRKQKYMHRFISNEDIERFKNLIIAEEHKNCKDYINYKKSYEYLFYFGFTKIRDKCKDILKIIARMKKELEEINDLKEDRKGS